MTAFNVHTMRLSDVTIRLDDTNECVGLNGEHGTVWLFGSTEAIRGFAAAIIAELDRKAADIADTYDVPEADPETDDEEDDDCFRCGGSGGGPDPENSCGLCRGSGKRKAVLDTADRD